MRNALTCSIVRCLSTHAQAWAVLVGFIILSTTIAYMGRYDVSAAPGAAALVTDRWTGTVKMCATVLDNVTVMCFPRFPEAPLTR
ncbi:MAG TPA: hypothetical protein DDZ81_10245 [Acetobacteraceae bacterium]|nr:hypothetical protein [Acetobacteraceae bacterium]